MKKVAIEISSMAKYEFSLVVARHPQAWLLVERNLYDVRILGMGEDKGIVIEAAQR